MKSYREELWFETNTRRAYLNITGQVEAAVRKSGVREGLVLVNAMHITASVYINDDEGDCFRITMPFSNGSHRSRQRIATTKPARTTATRISNGN